MQCAGRVLRRECGDRVLGQQGEEQQHRRVRPQLERGGGKFANSTNITVTGNTFSNNNGSGLWFDVGDSQISVTNNVSTNNTNDGGNGGGDGIRGEGSLNATPSGQTTSGNGVGG